MNAEQIIKKVLDGHFFTFNADKQKTCVRRVAKNYIPDHTPKFSIVTVTPSSNARAWTSQEDDLLIEMFHKGYSYKKMGQIIGVSISAAINRYRALCLTRNLDTKRKELHEKYSAEVHQRVVYLKTVEKMTFWQIADVMRMNRNQIAGIWRRHRSKCGLVEQAA